MSTSDNLLNAIKGQGLLTELGDCLSVPVRMAMAFSGDWQNQEGQKTITTNAIGIAEATKFVGEHNQTAVWHFSMNHPVHHFVVIPLADKGNLEFSIMMAYAESYTLGEYLTGTGAAPGSAGGNGGYRDRWQVYELQRYLSRLVTVNGARLEYFGDAGANSEITFNKYPNVDLETAVTNVDTYNLALP